MVDARKRFSLYKIFRQCYRNQQKHHLGYAEVKAEQSKKTILRTIHHLV